ncbi:MAG: transcriptional regulator [Oleiphilus sp.]|nr:MAG: transcriptional regulator [Oleiphilus sp.]
MRWEEIDGQVCSIARALAIFGDRWTLLIIRDAFRRVRRFSDFQKSLGITRHRLSDRLSRLVEYGILEKRLYDAKRARYEYRLTEKGLDLYPVLMSVVNWGDKWACDGDGSPVVFRHLACGQPTHPKMVCDVCDEPIDAREIRPEVGPGVLKKIARGDDEIKGYETGNSQA